MKVSRFCLLLLVASILACREHRNVVPVAISPDYKKGQAFLNVNDDSAFYYFNKVATSSRDSLQVAMAFSNMAQIQADKGDYFGSQESLLTSLKYVNDQKPEDNYCLLSDFNQLGRNSSDLKNYAAAIDYYDTALKFSKNGIFKVIALNNKAVAYQHMGRYAQAIDIYDSIIDRSRKNKREYARILSNLARVRWLQDPAYRAAPELLKALQMRQDENDEWGLNASYAHLSDYYSHSRRDSALMYAGKMYAIAYKLNSPDDELEALQKLIVLSPPKQVKQYFSKFLYLSDSLQTARNAAKNQFALIRYEGEKNKADILRLQKDNTEEKIRIIQQRTVLYGAIIIFIIVSLFVVARFRKQRLKISRKVHDVVANGLYRVMAEVEHRDSIDRGQLLDELEVLYEQSRDISYDRLRNDPGDFHEIVSKLLGSFSGGDVTIGIVGNNRILWDHVNEQIKREMGPVLQELMINMKKHSSAQNVVVRFERKGDQLIISYADDGVGLPSSFSYGNGLSNTENRIARIGGRISFGKNTEKGLKIQLYLPTT